MSVTKLSKLCKCLASTKFGSRVAVCLPEKVVAKMSTLTTASTDTISLHVTSLTAGRVFAISPCGARTTTEDIILNVNMWREEERKRNGYGQLQERADILYPLKRKSIVLVFNNFFVSCLSLFYLLIFF